MSAHHELAELQRAFQRHVLHGDATICGSVQDDGRMTVAARLAIYSDAYRLRLIEALASNAPRLERLLGKQDFAALALRYIERHPSRCRSIRWFGDQLAQMLVESHPTQPWLAELARWEWAIATAFDASDAQPIDEHALSSLRPEDWAALTFRFQAAVQRLQMRTNAPALFKILSADDAEMPLPPGAVLDQTQEWLIWRQDLTPRFRSLPADEAVALDTLRSGGTFAHLCEALCLWHEPEHVPLHAASLLKRWLHEGLISGL
jgi:hypothetical protein